MITHSLLSLVNSRSRSGQNAPHRASARKNESQSAQVILSITIAKCVFIMLRIRFPQNVSLSCRTASMLECAAKRSKYL